MGQANDIIILYPQVKASYLYPFNPQGCFNLGHLYYKGEGIEQNTNIAKQLWGKACILGSQDGCSNYAKLNQK